MAAISAAAPSAASLPSAGAPNTPGMAAEYAEYARAQRYAARALLPAFTAAFATAATSVRSLSVAAIRVMELGVADGCNTDLFVDVLLDQLAAHPHLAVELVLLDVPSSPHWGTLLKRVAAWTARAASAHLSLFISVQPGSFYDTFAPRGSIDILYACTALHWSAGGIVTPPDFDTVGYTYWFCAPPSDARSRFADRMRRDLDTILRHAHSALRAGGFLLAVTPSRDVSPDGAVVKHWYKRGLDALYDVMREVRASGYIPATNSATVEEWMEAIARVRVGEGEQSVAAFQDVQVSGISIPDEYWLSARDAAEYGRSYSHALEAVIGPIVARMRQSYGVDDAAFWTSVAARMADLYAAAPQGQEPEEVGVSTILAVRKAV